MKLFVDGPALPVYGFIPVFHDWIKHHRLGELLVDVASYGHVPNGPGVGIVGHGSDYFVDSSEGRQGLLYSRKRDFPAEALREMGATALEILVRMLEGREPDATHVRLPTSMVERASCRRLD